MSRLFFGVRSICSYRPYHWNGPVGWISQSLVLSKSWIRFSKYIKSECQAVGEFAGECARFYCLLCERHGLQVAVIICMNYSMSLADRIESEPAKKELILSHSFGVAKLHERNEVLVMEPWPTSVDTQFGVGISTKLKKHVAGVAFAVPRAHVDEAEPLEYLESGDRGMVLTMWTKPTFWS